MQYCKPLNIEYKYQHYGKWAHREAADPALFADDDGRFYYRRRAWQHHGG